MARDTDTSTRGASGGDRRRRLGSALPDDVVAIARAGTVTPDDIAYAIEHAPEPIRPFLDAPDAPASMRGRGLPDDFFST